MVWLSCKSFWEINTLSAGMPLTPNLLESWSTRGSPKGTASQLPAMKVLGVPYLGCSWNISLFRDTVFTKSIKHYHKDRYGFWRNSDEGTCDWKPKIHDFHKGLTMSLLHIIHLSRFTAVWRHKDHLHLVAFDSIFRAKRKRTEQAIFFSTWLPAPARESLCALGGRRFHGGHFCTSNCSTLLYPSLFWYDVEETDRQREPMIDTKII